MSYFRHDYHFRSYRADEERAQLMALVLDSLPAAVKRGDKEAVRTLEETLATSGMACPNSLSPIWNGPPDVPRNEVQVREMHASRMPAHGYRIAASQEAFPDWLLQDIETGEFVLAEVEHRSSSFLAHGHDPAGCQMVVCWEHDEPLPFLDVLELFSGTMHRAENPLPLNPDLKARAFGGYAASRFGKKAAEDAKERRRDKAGKRTGQMGAYDRAMLRARWAIGDVDAAVEKGKPKTEAVADVAESHRLGESTVWAMLKKRHEYGL